MTNNERETFDEDIIAEEPAAMKIVDDAIDEDETAEEDLFFNHMEDLSLDSILGDIDDEIDSIYVDYNTEEE